MSLSLNINGIAHIPLRILWHYQSGPFPGNHRYRLEIAGDLVQELSAIEQNKKSQRIEVATNELFEALYWAQERVGIPDVRNTKNAFIDH
jgi:hypothetical protein